MLELTVHDGKNNVVLKFEHSLLSLSKWESKHKKAFLATPMKTSTDMIEYFEDMLLNPEVGSDLIYRLTPEQLDELSNYVNDPMTASSVPKDNARPSRETVTSELIYYWMVALKINWAAESWHLNRLMMLIQITNYKQQPEKKRAKSDMLNKWREANARNKERFGTNG